MVDADFQQQDTNHPVEGAYAQPAPGIAIQVVTVSDDAGVSAFGPAGTESAAVMTVQGYASGTAIPVTGTADGVAQGSTTSGQSGTLVQGAVTTSAPTYTTAKSNPLSLTTAGRLRVDAAGSVSAGAYRDSIACAAVASSAAAPAGGANVATVTPGTEGLWEISGTVSISGTTVAAAETNNMNLKVDSTTILTNIPIGVTGTTGASGAVPFGPVVVSVGAAHAVTVNAVGAATASSIYGAQIVCRRVG